MAKRLLSRARLAALQCPILPPSLTRFLSGDPTAPKNSEPEDKAKKAAAASATAVVVEASANSRREDADISSRDASEDDDEGAGLPWAGWRPDVAWLSRVLEPALHLYKQYNWKPFTCSSTASLSSLFQFSISPRRHFDSAMRVVFLSLKLSRMHLINQLTKKFAASKGEKSICRISIINILF
jgi:hypothetical protein